MGHQGNLVWNFLISTNEVSWALSHPPEEEGAAICMIMAPAPPASLPQKDNVLPKNKKKSSFLSLTNSPKPLLSVYTFHVVQSLGAPFWLLDVVLPYS